MTRLEVEDEGETKFVLMPMITLNDDAVETLKIIDHEDQEQTHSVFVKPYHNCLDMDSQHLTSYIKDHLLVPPSTAEYSFSRPLDQLNKTSLLSSEKFLDGLLDLWSSHVVRGTGALVVAAMLDFLTFALCAPYR